jgi:hypothetical protein
MDSLLRVLFFNRIVCEFNLYPFCYSSYECNLVCVQVLFLETRVVVCVAYSGFQHGHAFIPEWIFLSGKLSVALIMVIVIL